MSTVRVSCTGMRVGRLLLPPFQVGTGELVCLHVPREGVARKDELNELLRKGQDAPGLRFFGTVAFVDRPMPERGFLGRWRNPRILNWLTQRAGIASDQAKSILQRWHEPERRKIGLIQWNQRTWIALDVALTSGADIIVLDTAGNGDDGIQVAYDFLATRLEHHAVIHISHPSNRERVCFTGAHCIELGTEEPKWSETAKATLPLKSS